MFACAMSCCWYESTSFVNRVLSFCVKRSLVWSKRCICASSFRVAISKRGFRGCWGLMVWLSEFRSEFSSFFCSHFFVKFSDINNFL